MRLNLDYYSIFVDELRTVLYGSQLRSGWNPLLDYFSYSISRSLNTNELHRSDIVQQHNCHSELYYTYYKCAG